MGFAGRALHFVFKIANRTQTAKFYRDVLGMKVLRHEEFTEGCEAACNGPYDNRWSKTMVGYGPEDTHFVVELTYNYNVDKYAMGNSFLGVVIKSRDAIARARAVKWPVGKENSLHYVDAPDGYRFYLLDEPQPTDKDPVEKVILASSDLKASLDYWARLLGLKAVSKSEESVVLSYSDNQAQLELRKAPHKIDFAESYGRIAFSVPHSELANVQTTMEKERQKILKPLVTLDTPGKASVTVVILADPDGHEICFVDDENFRELSKFDPEGDVLLNRFIKKDEARKAAAASPGDNKQ